MAKLLHSNAADTLPVSGKENGRAKPGRRLGAVDWLSLAATPTFSLMALVSATGGGAEMLCSSTMQDLLPLSGMAVMYVLMSVFHLAPWLRLISSSTTGRPPSTIVEKVQARSTT
jgi:hypothetical protein